LKNNDFKKQLSCQTCMRSVRSIHQLLCSPVSFELQRKQFSG